MNSKFYLTASKFFWPNLTYTITSIIVIAVAKVQRDATDSDNIVIINDFESGLGSWQIFFDEFPDTENLGWTIEHFESPIDGLGGLGPTAPKPLDGNKYLRLLGSAFGVSKLESPKVFVLPDDQLSVTHWIQSTHKTFNNLEIFWILNGIEIKLSSITSNSHNDWIVDTIHLPFPKDLLNEDRGFTTQFLFYGYRGLHEGDAVAIDDIILYRSTSSTEPYSTSISEESSSHEPATHPSSTLFGPPETTSNSMNSSLSSNGYPPLLTSTGIEKATQNDKTEVPTTSYLPTTQLTIQKCPQDTLEKCPSSIPIPLPETEYVRVSCYLLENCRCYCISTKYVVNGTLSDVLLEKFTEADYTCSINGMTMVVLEDAAENELVTNFLRQNPVLFGVSQFWTSAVFHDVQQVFVWGVGKTPYKKLTYFDWVSGAPFIQPLTGAVRIVVSSNSTDGDGAWMDHYVDERIAGTFCELQ